MSYPNDSEQKKNFVEIQLKVNPSWEEVRKFLPITFVIMRNSENFFERKINDKRDFVCVKKKKKQETFLNFF